MANIAEHCSDCIKELGKPFIEVHEWLDEFAIKFPPETHGVFHRKFRHNKEGVEKVRSAWGDDGARAAVIHINRDDGIEFGGVSSLDREMK
jgi:hypothetical protein